MCGGDGALPEATSSEIFFTGHIRFTALPERGSDQHFQYPVPLSTGTADATYDEPPCEPDVSVESESANELTKGLWGARVPE